jgi:hypothetical protein
LLLLGAGNSAHAAERRQVEEAFVVRVVMFPNEEAGALMSFGARKRIRSRSLMASAAAASFCPVD